MSQTAERRNKVLLGALWPSRNARYESYGACFYTGANFSCLAFLLLL